MSIRVLSERAVVPGKERHVVQLMRTLQKEAISSRGFIGSSAFRDSEHPERIVVISEWQSRAAWLQWQEEPSRQGILEEMRQYLFGPITHRVLVPLAKPQDDFLL